MQKYLRFDGTVRSMFRVLLYDFKKNFMAIAALSLVFLAGLIPYLIIFSFWDVFLHFPLTTFSGSGEIGPLLMSFLMSIWVFVLMPAAVASYFLPKISNILFDDNRESLNYTQRFIIGLNRFGKLSAASAYRLLIMIIPNAAVAIYGLLLVSGVAWSDLTLRDPKYLYFVLTYIVVLMGTWVFGLLTLFTRQVVFFENEKGFKAVSRSFHLVTGKNFWPTTGRYIVALLTVLAEVAIIGTLIFVGYALPFELPIGIFLFVACSILFSVLEAVLFSVAFAEMEIVISGLYFNARARAEGILLSDNVSE